MFYPILQIKLGSNDCRIRDSLLFGKALLWLIGGRLKEGFPRCRFDIGKDVVSKVDEQSNGSRIWLLLLFMIFSDEIPFFLGKWMVSKSLE